MSSTNPSAVGHVWSSSYERLGDDNRMLTRCLTHPEARPFMSFNWPTLEELKEFEVEHQLSLDSVELPEPPC